MKNDKENTQEKKKLKKKTDNAVKKAEIKKRKKS